MHTLFARRLAARAARGHRQRVLLLEDGFTLIETLIAAFVLAIGIGGLFGMLSISVKATGSSPATKSNDRKAGNSPGNPRCRS